MQQDLCLIPLKKEEDRELLEKGIWNKFHTILIRKCGDIDDHSTFLCSLLLGFGMKAFVVLGTNSKG